MQVEQWPIDRPIPYENNPRVNDDAVDKVANSIKEFGFKSAILVDKDDVIICGHTRLKAAQKLGLKKVPVSVADDLTDEQVKAYRLADNKTAEFADWDWDKLADELDDICDIDMSDFGFEIDNEKDEDYSKDISDNLEMSTVIVIDCETEDELELAFEKLTEEGYKCRLLTL